MPQRPLALVTGASSGIGAAFAERLARDGYDLILVAHRRNRLQDLAARLNQVEVEVLAADLAELDMRRAVEARLAEGGVSLMVNMPASRAIAACRARSRHRRAPIALHCTALVRLTRAALPGMIARQAGAVINVSSMLAFSGAIPMPHLYRANYAATKAFINTFTEILSHELDGTGVKVQALCPGVVRTELHDNLGGTPQGVAVLEPGDIVAAALKGLELGEVICAPTLADPAAIEEYGAARRAAMFAGGREAAVAARYRDAT